MQKEKLLKIKNINPIYYEQCNKISMPTYSFFISKLEQIQKLTHKIVPSQKLMQRIEHGKPFTKNQDVIEKRDKNKEKQDGPENQDVIEKKEICVECSKKHFFMLSNIIWNDTIQHKIESHQSYPSEYFINVILNTSIIDNHIINPPIQLTHEQINHFSYIYLHYNKLLIIDALMQQGSYPRYQNNDKFIYSEHSGTISVKNKTIDNIIVSAETADTNDNMIFLPINTPKLAKYEYLFHTHPNTLTYGGRINEGIIYEFPSANDIFNFIEYYNKGKVLASIIVTPEGMYVIRPIKYTSKYTTDPNFFYTLREYILDLERMALKMITPKIKIKITDPNIFHQLVSSNFIYISMYNNFIEGENLFIEYYPREKKNNEWCLRPISLPHLEQIHIN